MQTVAVDSTTQEPEIITPSQALVVVESVTAMRLFAPGFIDPLLDKIKEHARSEAAGLDISRDADRKAMASLAYKIAKAKNFIDSQRKSLVADEKKRLASIDKEGKRVWDEMESLQQEVRKPLTDWENAEKQRIEQLEAAIAEIAAAGPYTLQNWMALTVECMQDRLAEITGDDRGWQEFSARAKYAKGEAVAAITEAIAKRQHSENEQAELARLRAEQVEREQEQRIRDAADRARREAEATAEAERLKIESKAREREEAERAAKEQAVRDKQHAEAVAAKAEQDKLAAIEKAKRDTVEATRRAKLEQEAAIQRERDRVAAEAKAQADAEAKRESDKKYVAKINREALGAFLKAGFDEATGKAIITLIARGEVPHVSIQY